MSSAIRVAFAGLAHSHPFADAEGVRALGAEVVAVFDSDAATRDDFAARFGGVACDAVAELADLRPDIVVATPHPDEAVSILRALIAHDARAPVFFNKIVAATTEQLTRWESAMAHASPGSVGTASVLRFAPVLGRLAADVAECDVLGLRVRVQHDNAGFQRAGRAWQDDPLLGGGTVVTVGVHAWEIVGRILPGAVIETGAGWTRRRRDSTTRSEDAGGFRGSVRIAVGEVPVDVVITGLPGPDAYGVEVLTSAGLRSVELDVTSPRETLGYTGLSRILVSSAEAGTAPAPWAQSRTVVRNTVTAAELIRQSYTEGVSSAPRA